MTRAVSSTRIAVAAIVVALLAGGCAINMSTAPSQVTSVPGPARNYAELTCAQLADELGIIARRETPLAAAQERRVKRSNVQALVIGVGQGDGEEAAELAKVRGEREAVRNAMVARQCGR